MKSQITDLIGNTPVINYRGVYLKLEGFNLGGSIKDRVVLNIIEAYERNNLLSKENKMIEATSGNTGIALAMICALKGYEAIIVVPKNINKQKQKIMEAYGAKIIKVDKGIEEARKVAEQMALDGKYIFLNQFNNVINPWTHYEKTATEIIYDFPNLDYLVAGIGSGGTITGLAKRLKEYYPNLYVIGVEPKEANLINGGSYNRHVIDGLGPDFISPLLDLSIIDEIIDVKGNETIDMMQKIAKDGLLLGPSTIASLLVALEIKKQNPNANILVISPDNGLKYLDDCFEE